MEVTKFKQKHESRVKLVHSNITMLINDAKAEGALNEAYEVIGHAIGYHRALHQCVLTEQIIIELANKNIDGMSAEEVIDYALSMLEQSKRG